MDEQETLHSEIIENGVEGYEEVHPLHYKADRRREFMVIVAQSGEAWLMPTSDVPGDYPFRLTLTELAKLPRPYNFKKELEALMPTLEELNFSLWLAGIVTKDDLRNVSEVRNALGILPSANAFVKFAVGD